MNSLFAKCYLSGDEIHILYTQKQFQDNIEDMELSTKAFRNDDSEDSKYFFLGYQPDE